MWSKTRRTLNRGMTHYLYKLTCRASGKYYIGVHSTENMNDGYLGSGVGIRRARKKYGDEVIDKEILSFADSREELLEMERAAVTREVVTDPLSYNMTLGGNSVVDYYRVNGEEAFIEHQREAGRKGAVAFHASKTEEQRREWHAKGGRAYHRKLREQGLPHPTKGQKRTEETKRLMSERCKAKPKHKCPYCERSFDSGNLKIHLTFKHQDKE